MNVYISSEGNFIPVETGSVEELLDALCAHYDTIKSFDHRRVDIDEKLAHTKNIQNSLPESDLKIRDNMRDIVPYLEYEETIKYCICHLLNKDVFIL